MNKAAAPVRGPMQRTPEWYALKVQTDPPVFGASEAAALCGLSDYATPLDIYLNRVDPQPSEETAPMLAGRFLEPAILGLYGETFGRAVTTGLPVFIHPQIAYLAASLDGERADDKRPVEAKWSMSPQIAEQLGEEGGDWVPTQWLMQVQQQMDVTDTPAADIAVFIFGRLRTYTVHRDNDVIDAIHRAAAEMKERIERRDPPPLDFNHQGAVAALRRAYPEVIEEAVVFDGPTTAAATRYIERAKQIRELSKQQDADRAAILAAMGGAALGKLAGKPVQFRRTRIEGGKQVSYVTKPQVRLTHRSAK